MFSAMSLYITRSLRFLACEYLNSAKGLGRRSLCLENIDIEARLEIMVTIIERDC